MKFNADKGGKPQRYHPTATICLLRLHGKHQTNRVWGEAIAEEFYPAAGDHVFQGYFLYTKQVPRHLK